MVYGKVWKSKGLKKKFRTRSGTFSCCSSYLILTRISSAFRFVRKEGKAKGKEGKRGGEEWRQSRAGMLFLAQVNFRK
jgi:hypothetical protein